MKVVKQNNSRQSRWLSPKADDKSGWKPCSAPLSSHQNTGLRAAPSCATASVTPPGRARRGNEKPCVTRRVAECWGRGDEDHSPRLAALPCCKSHSHPPAPAGCCRKLTRGAGCSLRQVPGSGSSYLSPWAPSAPALLLVCFVKHPRHWVAQLPQVNPGWPQTSQPPCLGEWCSWSVAHLHPSGVTDVAWHAGALSWPVVPGSRTKKR